MSAVKHYSNQYDYHAQNAYGYRRAVLVLLDRLVDEGYELPAGSTHQAIVQALRDIVGDTWVAQDVDAALMELK